MVPRVCALALALSLLALSAEPTAAGPTSRTPSPNSAARAATAAAGGASYFVGELGQLGRAGSTRPGAGRLYASTLSAAGH